MTAIRSARISRFCSKASCRTSIWEPISAEPAQPKSKRRRWPALLRASGYDGILNGRFKGGWTTRHYGRPEQKVHAIQMELAQSTHLTTEAPPFAYDEAKADRLRRHLTDILERNRNRRADTRPVDRGHHDQFASQHS